MVAGQITGGLAHAVGAALYEEFAYAPDGAFLAGTFADYLVPTATEVPAPLILHIESPSPFTPLGAKGVGEGNCMSTPVCIANAVADALGVNALDLPLTPAKLAALLRPPEHELAEAHAVPAAEGADASVIAGGQSLLPLLSFRLARPKVVVDIMRIPGLDLIARDSDGIRIGAGVRQASLAAWPELVGAQPLLALALPHIGHAQTRSRGTVCGSVAHADPSAEIPLVLTALAGEVVLSSARRLRRVAAADFFTGLMSTARADDELIEAVIVPRRRAGQGYAFREFARRHGDFAIVACAAIASERDARLAVGGVGDKPVAFDRLPLYGTALDKALDRIARELDARDDLHATAAYRRDLVRRLGRSAIVEARQCRA
jgi:2-furoyl-CoA dehydrogenase FAD binding subunit